MVLNHCLRINLNYDIMQYNVITVRSILFSYKRNLLRIIEECMKIKSNSLANSGIISPKGVGDSEMMDIITELEIE